MNSFFASLLPKAAAPAKKAATKKRGRGKVKSKKGTKEESKPVDEAELMKNLNIELQKRFEGIVADVSDFCCGNLSLIVGLGRRFSSGGVRMTAFF